MKADISLLQVDTPMSPGWDHHRGRGDRIIATVCCTCSRQLLAPMRRKTMAARMSAIRRIPDFLCSLGVLSVLTHSGPHPPARTVSISEQVSGLRCAPRERLMSPLRCRGLFGLRLPTRESESGTFGASPSINVDLSLVSFLIHINDIPEIPILLAIDCIRGSYRMMQGRRMQQEQQDECSIPRAIFHAGVGAHRHCRCVL